MNNNQTLRGSIFCLLALAAMPLTGCTSGTSTSTSTREPSVRAICAIDASAGARPHLYESTTLVARMADGLADGDHLTCFRLDDKLEGFYDDIPPSSVTEFETLLGHELGQPADKTGTYPAEFWTEAARQALIDKATKTGDVIVMLGDGDDDAGRESYSAITAAARKIAENPAAVVVFIGASRENWNTIQAQFSPLSGRLLRTTAAGASLDDLQRSVDQARTLAGKE